MGWKVLFVIAPLHSSWNVSMPGPQEPVGGAAAAVISFNRYSGFGNCGVSLINISLQIFQVMNFELNTFLHFSCLLLH